MRFDGDCRTRNLSVALSFSFRCPSARSRDRGHACRLSGTSFSRLRAGLDPRRDRAPLLPAYLGARFGDADFADHMSRARGEDEYPVGERDRLVDVVRDKHGGDPPAFD
jgi:hypothetical protein